MHPEWDRLLRDQCQAAGVPFLFKQWGEWAPVCEMSEEAIDACYFPAPGRHPEASRRRKVDQCVLHSGGRKFDGTAMYELPAFEQGSGAMTMMRVGKKAAGRMLDGREWTEFPA
jgi:protein gp37